MNRWLTALAAWLLVSTAACGGDDQDPDGARRLWDRIHAENYRGSMRAPGYETRQPGRGPHAKQVDIYVNAVVGDALAKKAPLTQWPVGSLIVKDGWDGSKLELVAAMEKRQDGWTWAEWSGSGESSYSGRPSICTDCHGSGSDFVRAFALPK